MMALQRPRRESLAESRLHLEGLWGATSFSPFSIAGSACIAQRAILQGSGKCLPGLQHSSSSPVRAGHNHMGCNNVGHNRCDPAGLLELTSSNSLATTLIMNRLPARQARQQLEGRFRAQGSGFRVREMRFKAWGLGFGCCVTP